MRLKGLLAIVTGASGGIGQVIVEKFLQEGAEVIGTGRSLEKLESFHHEKFHPIVMDATDLDSILAGVQSIRKKFGKIDILVNNAGSPGPMDLLVNLPSATKPETLQDALESLLGFPWIMTCALYPQFAHGASIINVSSIFSKFNYFGRTAYTVPKAALNALSQIMAEELGSAPIELRVNTVFPGPVESERIHRVFTAMDGLRNVSEGTTEKEITSQMILKGHPFVSKEDVVNTILYLAGSESKGISGQEFEVTNGLQVSHDNTIEISLSPNPKIVNLDGYFSWIIGGSDLEIATSIAQKHYDKGSTILLTFRDVETMKKAAAMYQELLNFKVMLFDPTNTEDWKIMGRSFAEAMHFPGSVFVLPYHSNEHYFDLYGDSVSRMPIEKVQDFLMTEIADAILTGSHLAKIFAESNPNIVFISNPSDRKGNKFNRILTSAIEQLIRTWRLEISQSNIWQILRYKNEQSDNSNFTSNLAISISAGITKATHLNMAIAAWTQQPPFGFTYNQKYHQMLGNLDNMVALITGGSEGIGRETARIMVQGGAFVSIASRNADKLNKTKKFLVKELTANGFPEADLRIDALELDVKDPQSIKKAFDTLISKHGTIDFLINNAGITGQEQMYCDMDIEGWRATLRANLTSNYDLMLRSLPYMKKQKRGNIVNISSAFGGSKYATPSYPIRADYAVSKSGQRALSESFAAIIGPDVKINTVSPGPVEGDRVRGDEKHPGLYLRRAKINAENKILNQVYDNLIDKWRLTHELVIDNLKMLTKPLAERLLKRLKLGGYITEIPVLNEFKQEVVSEEELIKNAASIANRAVKMLALQKMPSEYDIGREVVFNVTSHSVTGETLYPSCGLAFDRLSLHGESTIEFDDSMYQHLTAKTVMIVGNSMPEYMAEVAAAFCQAPSVEQVCIENKLIDHPKIVTSCTRPDVVISFPTGSLPEDELPSLERFNQAIEEHLTNHFIVGQKASLVDNCRIFFVTHPGGHFAQFLASTLAPLTVTAGQESFRITHKARFFQINASKDVKRVTETILIHCLPQKREPIFGQVITL